MAQSGDCALPLDLQRALEQNMAIAEDSGGQKRLSKERGVKFPKVLSGNNKLPPQDLQTQKQDDKSQANTNKNKMADDAELIAKAKKRFTAARKVEDENRTAAVEDLKFLKGDQWGAADEASRAAEGRPCNTENRIPTFAAQITNDQRQNRPSINISPMGDKAAKKDAKILRGMIRAIERDSTADVAYDTGFASAVHNGWGYWRVMTEYESERSFNKVIVVKSIPNPMNVYLDPARTPFMLDAKWGFISEMLPREEFTRMYPDANPIAWGEAGIGENDKEWVTSEAVRVAEYYYTTYKDRELVMLDNGHEGWEDDLDDVVVERIKHGEVEVLDRRTVACERIKWCKLTALEVLEELDCDGQYVPIIECSGTVININGKTIKKGIIRDAKGPQRQLNYYTTLETENVALQPKAPWVMEEGQIEGHEESWKSANKKTHSYLLYKSVNVNGKPAPPPQRQPFAGPPAAILAAKQGAVEALKAITGIRFDATMSERMQDESGKAIRELNQNANLGAYHYIDNFGRALKNTGIVLVDLIPYTYDTKRIVSILDEDGSEDRIMINPNMSTAHAEVSAQQTPEQSTGNGKVKMFNPKVGRYQVTVTIGPSYATKRIEAMEQMTDFLRIVPQLAPQVADLIAQNSDWPGAEQLATRFAKMLPPNLLALNKDDVNPQVQALIQGLQQQLQQDKLQMMQMQKELMDRDKDRAVLTQQIMTTFEAKQNATEKKFEAEVLKLGSKMEEIQQKKEAVMQGTIGRQLAEIAKAVAAMTAQQDKLSANPTDGSTPGQSANSENQS